MVLLFDARAVRALADRGAHRPCTAAMSKAHVLDVAEMSRYVQNHVLWTYGGAQHTVKMGAIRPTKTILIHEFRITIKTEIVMNNVAESLEYDGPINAVNRANATKNIPGKHSVYH